MLDCQSWELHGAARSTCSTVTQTQTQILALPLTSHVIWGNIRSLMSFCVLTCKVAVLIDSASQGNCEDQISSCV